ncbi:MAG TPA: transcription-repair coupling factor [bacterium]|nr:transcription-repair coupling factor [bacterium]
MALSGILPLLDRRREFLYVCEHLERGDSPWVMGPSGAGKALVVAGLIAHFGGRAPAWLILTLGRDAAERLADDLAAFLPASAGRVHLLAPWESFSPEDPPSVEAEGARQRILEALRRGLPQVIVASAGGVVHAASDPRWIDTVRVELAPGAPSDLGLVVQRLTAAGYERTDLVRRPGEVAVRGGLIDVYPSTEDHPVRIEWAGDEIESLRAFDPETQRTVGALPRVAILPARPSGGAAATLLDLVPDAVCVLDEPDELERQARALHEQAIAAYRRAAAAGRVPATAPIPAVPWDRIASALDARRTVALSTLHGSPRGSAVELSFGALESFAGQTAALAGRLRDWAAAGRRVVVASRQAHRMIELLADHGVAAGLVEHLDDLPAAGSVCAVPQALTGGFTLDDLVVVTDAEILGWRRRRRHLRWVRDGARISSWTELAPGDLVVHIHHGIGVYRGLERLTVGGGERDYLHLEYAHADALYVPTDQINLVQRYVGVEGQAPQIHRLGGTEWEREKRRVRERTREIARELLELYAARETRAGHVFAPDTPWQREMEEAFTYEETPDQWQAIQDVKRDMESSRPMDRLVSGDVGYGKTEVAVRAAFKAVMDGKQVAVLVPTTILAQQHFTVFQERFAAFPIRVEMLSRFRTPREQKAIVDALRTGAVDVIIGTHRLLSRSVTFKDLGLVIIDEEQRFGVTHKERLKQLRTQVDVLTLTATPIPRTLHMSLAGLRDLSVMETPPEARQPIRTAIREESPELIREAIQAELNREGQVYVIHNRVETIERAAARIRRLVPDARVAVAHGQMPEERLERVMLDFLGGRCDVLVSTTIVEIGLDIPRVNTIIIEDAHTLGLAQLYQLRGRVGRADRQAYAYLLYPRHVRLTPEAEQRLVAMREFVELGSGLRLAMRDLEIRGAGNLLGPEQHGHLAAVGFDLYLRLLEEAVREARGEVVEEPPEVSIDLDVGAYLPDTYIRSPAQRMAAYRQLAAAQTVEEGRAAIAELRDRYGPLPQPVQHLAEIIRLRALARRAGVASITRDRAGVLVRLSDQAARSGRMRALSDASRGRLELTPEGILLRTDGSGLAETLRRIGEMLDVLAGPEKSTGGVDPAPRAPASR